MFDLSKKVIFIAGGAGYLALPVARGLLEQGASISIGDYNSERLKEAVTELKTDYPAERIMEVTFDIGSEESIDYAINQTVNRFDKLDVVINATFATSNKRVEDLTAEEFDRTNHINITGSFLLARRSAEEMKNGGSIIMYSSMYGILAPNPASYPSHLNPNPINYGAGKAAIIQIVKYLAGYYGNRNIRVNAVAPGAFPWESQQEEEFIKKLSEKAMLGRIGLRNETAGAVVFLASDEASFITGEVISIDGGVNAW